MIVPSSRLLLWTALMVVPLVTVGTVMPEPIVPLLLLAALILGVAALDATLVFGALDNIEAEFPDVARLTQDRPGAVTVHLRNKGLRVKRLQLALAMPRQIVSKEEILDVRLSNETELSSIQWECTPLRRGQYHLDACYFECGSFLGFWRLRSKAPAQAEIRVYPNLASERKQLAALFLNRGGVGVHAQRLLGKGRDFEKLREYIPGDSYEDIHWKASAKRGRPVTKIFQIERTQEVYVIIDASRLSARHARQLDPDSAESSEETTILERYIASALVLGQAAARQNDLFGLLVFSDKTRRFLPARNGKAHYGACRDALYTLEPEIVSPDFEELFTFIRLRLRRRALLVFLTNLDDPALSEGFTRHIDLLSRRHVVLANMLTPRGVAPLFSKDSAVENTKDLYRRLGGHILHQRLRELEKVLHLHGVALRLLSNEKMCAELVTQYINVKQRQLL